MLGLRRPSREQELVRLGLASVGVADMMDLFSDDMRRNPYPAYDQVRSSSPVFLPQFDLWMVFDFDGVKRALVDHDTSAPTCRTRLATAGGFLEDKFCALKSNANVGWVG